MMTYKPDIHQRRSVRLKGYDYCSAGAYFLTVCAWQRECLFGSVAGEMVNISDYGKIIVDVWNKLPERFQSVELDEFVIMPNHLHGIIKMSARMLKTSRPKKANTQVRPYHEWYNGSQP